jgi:ABC-type phosphate transport system ATPase subunit
MYFDYKEFLLQGQVIEYNIICKIFTNHDRKVTEEQKDTDNTIIP